MTSSDFTTYVSYSVGAFHANGREIGGEFQTREEAQERFKSLQTEMANIASVSLYGWQEDGTCDEIDSWVAGNDAAERAANRWPHQKFFTVGSCLRRLRWDRDRNEHDEFVADYETSEEALTAAEDLNNGGTPAIFIEPVGLRQAIQRRHGEYYLDGKEGATLYVRSNLVASELQKIRAHVRAFSKDADLLAWLDATITLVERGF
jgi:hypothetical protein